MDGLGFYFFGRLIPYYGLMIVTGILVNIPVALVQTKRFGLGMNDLITICGFCGLFGFIGAKVLYLVTAWKSIDLSRLGDINYVSSLMSGGLVFLGGVLGVLAAVLLCRGPLNIPVRPYVGACMGCLPLGHAFGRIGCHLVGCCYGIPYEGPFAVVYEHSPFAPHGVPLFPVQLGEAAAEFLLGMGLLLFSRRLRGYTALWVYLTVYSAVRFFLEFLRYDEARGGIGIVSTSQLLSVLLAAGALFCLARETRGNRLRL